MHKMAEIIINEESPSVLLGEHCTWLLPSGQVVHTRRPLLTVTFNLHTESSMHRYVSLQ